MATRGACFRDVHTSARNATEGVPYRFFDQFPWRPLASWRFQTAARKKNRQWIKIVPAKFFSPAKITRMNATTAPTTAQHNKITQLETAMAKLLAEVSRRGYYGTAGVILNVQDGRIQHIRVSTDRLLK